MPKQEQLAPYSNGMAIDMPSDKELELGRENRLLKLEVARLTKKADQVDFAFSEADRARVEKMNHIRAINQEREKMVELSSALAVKDSQLQAAIAQGDKLQSALGGLLSRVDELEEERKQMESAMSEIQSIAEEKDMKALKTGQLLGSIVAKLHARTQDRERQVTAAKEASTDVRTQMTDLMTDLSSITASVKTLATVRHFVKKLMAKLAVTRQVDEVLAAQQSEQTTLAEQDQDRMHQAKKRQEDYAYPPGTSLRTTATELQAMVIAGTLSADQMREVLAALFGDEDWQNVLAEQDQDRAKKHTDSPRQCQDQASQCNLGESGMSAADDLLRNARGHQVDGSRHRDPTSGRWIAGFWIPEPWRASTIGLSRAENSAVTAVGSKLR